MKMLTLNYRKLCSRTIMIICVGTALFLDPFLQAQNIFLRIPVDRAEGIRLEKEQKYVEAFVRFEDGLDYLKEIHQKDPAWNQKIIEKCIEEFQAAVDRLEPLATKQVMPNISGPDVNYYLSPSVRLHDALQSEQEGDSYGALLQYKIVLFTLETWRKADPKRETAAIENQIKQCQNHIAGLEPKVKALSTAKGTVQ